MVTKYLRVAVATVFILLAVAAPIAGQAPIINFMFFKPHVNGQADENQYNIGDRLVSKDQIIITNLAATPAEAIVSSTVDGGDLQTIEMIIIAPNSSTVVPLTRSKRASDPDEHIIAVSVSVVNGGTGIGVSLNLVHIYQKIP